MAKISLCAPFQLFNLLNQCSSVSRLAEINYLCLIGEIWAVTFNAGHLVRVGFCLISLLQFNSALAVMCLCVGMFYFVDARETDDYRMSHIPTAINAKMVQMLLYPHFRHSRLSVQTVDLIVRRQYILIKSWELIHNIYI